MDFFVNNRACIDSNYIDPTHDQNIEKKTSIECLVISDHGLLDQYPGNSPFHG